MDSYPEDDEDFEPTVALADDDDAPSPPPGLFDRSDAPEETEDEDDEPVTEAFAEPEPEPVQPELTEAPGKTPMGNTRGVTVSDEIDYKAPPLRALTRGKGDKGPDPRDQEAIGRKLIEALGHFGVEAKIVGVVSGPHVSLYELRLAPGIKVKKVTELANDLAYALASTDIRILAPIPGKQAVGVEVPNTRRRMVTLGDIYAGRPEKTSPLVAWLGKGIDGNAVWTDLAKMPHVLVAGTTGSGKSGCINAILSSILMQASPNDVRLVLVDPKQVELNHYENVPHLLTPVVTSPRLAANVLSNLIGEMESRYGIMSQARCRNLAELNTKREKEGEPPLPHILCVIDELADLMMVAPAEVEDSIIRLAQKSRATGIHLVLATQRPSTDIITGTIKVNIPARIAFAVSSQTDSRVILDQGGAESLLGQGDMLFRGAGSSKMQRVQGAFITEDEIARITNHWARQGEPEFEEELLETPEEAVDEGRGDDDIRPRRRRPPRRGDPARGADRNRFGLDDPAAPAGRLHPRRAADRHARAAWRHLRLRGLQTPPGADHPGRSDAGAAAGRGRSDPGPRRGRRRRAIPSTRRPPGSSSCGSVAGVIRAGIVVTGTEVITGRISDSNGPWVSEQLAGLGVEVAHILIVADRPDDLEAAAPLPERRGDGPDRDQRRARPDRRRPHRRGGRALRRARAAARPGDGGEDRRDHPQLRPQTRLGRRGGTGRRQPQAGDGARGGDGARPDRHRAGAGGAVRRG